MQQRSVCGDATTGASAFTCNMSGREAALHCAIISCFNLLEKEGRNLSRAFISFLIHLIIRLIRYVCKQEGFHMTLTLLLVIDFIRQSMFN